MLLTRPVPLTVRQNPARLALHLLSCVRMSEVIVLQGSPLLGLIFAMGTLTASRCMTIALLTTGSILLTAHIFVLNDWSGISGDLRDPNRRDCAFSCKGIGRDTVAILSLALLAAGLLLLSCFGLPTLAIALSIVILSALYSFPRVHLKGVPVLNSVLHFLGGLLHFLLGYSAFVAPDWRGVQIGSFFALVFVAGHLTHETRDSESDSLNEIRTNAVAFGKRRSFLGGLALFTVADVLLVFLALRDVVPRPLAVLAFMIPLHVYWSLEAIRSSLTFASVQRLRLRYRMLYAGAGLWIVTAVLLETGRPRNVMMHLLR